MNDTLADPARERFLQHVAHAVETPDGPLLQRLLLTKPAAVGAAGGALRVQVRPLLLRGQMHLSFVYSHATKDVTQNLLPAAGLARVAQLLGPAFRNAHLHTGACEMQLMLSKKGKGQ